MYASVRAFLDQIIDYAGLFPPAKLPLKDAVERYVCLTETSPHGRMLRSFVCPAARLHELFLLTKARRVPISVSSLGQAGANLEAFPSQTEADMRAIADYRQAWQTAAPLVLPDDDQEEDQSLLIAQHKRAGIHAYEVAPPASWPVEARSRGVADVLRIADHDLHVFFELPYANRVGLGQLPFGVKLRCGGLSAGAFPNDETIASFIMACRDERIPWKATAGLHHPRRHWDPALKVWHHGFLNVFAAGVLAWNHPVSEADLVELLADRELRDLRFEPDHMIWRKWECTTAANRRGPCELCDQLRQLQLRRAVRRLDRDGAARRDSTW